VCNPGHDGAACERARCPVGARSLAICSGHGSCLSLRDLGRQYGPDGSPSVRGDGVGPNYGSGTPAAWDADVIHACFCDGGFGSSDCSQSLCPKGPNPFTTGQQRRALSFMVDLNGVAVPAGQDENLYLRFLGAETSGLDAAGLASLSDAGCAAWAATHPFIREAACRKSVANTDEYSLELRVEWENVLRPQNNLFDHDGDPSLAEFTCDGRDVSSVTVTCAVADVDVLSAMTYAANGDSGSAIVIEVVSADVFPNTYKVTVGSTEYAPASMSASPAAVGALPNARVSWGVLWGHTAGARWHVGASNAVTPPSHEEHRECGGIGRCDPFLGACTCPSGVEGVACSSRALSMASIADNVPVSELQAEAEAYSGDILRLRATRTASSSFNFVSAVEGANAPLFTLSGEGRLRSRTLQADLGATVLSGGLFVGGGGATVLSGGLDIGAGSLSARSPAFDADAASVHASSALFQNSLLRLSADRGESDQFRILDVIVDADGSPSRLLHLRGNGQLEIVRGLLTVASNEGLRVTGTGGLAVSGGGATTSGGLVAETSATSGTAATVSVSDAAYTGAGFVLRAARAASSAFRFAEVTASGSAQAVLTHFGDGLVRIHRGGAEVSGGLTVVTGGLAVTAGSMRAGAGLAVDGGGLTVVAGGLAVTSGGATLSHDGAADAHTLRSSSTVLTASHEVVRIESDTQSTVSSEHALLWAGSRNGANAMTERMKLTAAGVLSVTGHVVLAAKRPAVTAAGATAVVLTESQCGSVVAAGSSVGAGVITVALPAQSGTETAGCFITVIIVDATREVQIRNSQLIGALYGKWLYHDGAAVALGSVSTTNFLTSAGGTGTALRAPAGAASLHASVTLTAVPQTAGGANQWYVSSANGPWQASAFT